MVQGLSFFYPCYLSWVANIRLLLIDGFGDNLNGLDSEGVDLISDKIVYKFYIKINIADKCISM